MRRHIGTMAALGGVLVAGAAISGASLGGTDTARSAGAAPEHTPRAEVTVERSPSDGPRQASRGGERRQVDTSRPSRHATPSELGGGGVSSAEKEWPDDPREIARDFLPDYGWGEAEFECLDELWIGESNWEVRATNPTSGAYGIPQSLPPEKMATAGADWRTNPVTQIRWGLDYIEQSYGTPCSANEFKNAHNWY
jgi:hypothetical protein